MMSRNHRVLSRAGRFVCPGPEVLEGRMLLSGASLAIQAGGAGHKEVVSLQVPSTYVSQSATSIDVTVARAAASKHGTVDGPLTLYLSAAALSPASKPGGKPVVSDEIAPLNRTLTFQAGETSQTVALPIFVQASLPSLVPVRITVAAKANAPQNEAVITADLASSQQLVPPSIVGASIVRQGSVGKGVELTFSEPMDPAVAENIHNYVLKAVPLNTVTLDPLSGSSVLQPTSYLTKSSPQSVPLKAARYDPTTDSVLLVPKTPLTVAKSFIVKSPATLGSRHPGPKAAAPLTDANGNVLNPLNFPEGSFSITISPKSS